MESASYQTFDFRLDPERAFTFSGVNRQKITKTFHGISSFEIGTSKVGDFYTNEKITTVELKPEGFHVSKSLGPTVDPNIAQAPIKPRVLQNYLGSMIIGSTFKIGGSPAVNKNVNNIYQTYVVRKSNTLLGNAVKGKISSTYYRSLDVNDRNDRMF